MSVDARPEVRWRLGATSRKSVLLVHIASAGAWLGIDVVMAVLVFTALLSDDDRTKALSFRALELVAVGPLLAAGLVCLLTGVLLGLGSKYGLLRYWWVVLKLALNLVLTGLVLVSLAPEVADAAERARQVDAGVPAPLGVGRPDLPPDRVPDGPAGGDGPGRIQAMGTHPQARDPMTSRPEAPPGC